MQALQVLEGYKLETCFKGQSEIQNGSSECNVVHKGTWANVALNSPEPQRK